MPSGRAIHVCFTIGVSLCAWLLLVGVPTPASAQVQRGVVSVDADRVESLAFSADGQTLAAYVLDEKTFGYWVVLIDVGTRKEVSRWKVSYPGKLLAFSPDGKTLYTSCLKPAENAPGKARNKREPDWLHVQFWDIKTRKPQRSLVLPPKWNFSGRLTHAGKTLVLFGPCRSDEPGVAGVYDTTTGKQRSFFELPKQLHSHALSPDDKYLAVGSFDGRVTLFALKTGKRVAEFNAPGRFKGNTTSGISGLVFTPDSKKLLCLSRDGGLLTVSVPAGKELERFTPKWVLGKCFAFLTPDGKRLVVDATIEPGFNWINLDTGEVLPKRPARIVRCNAGRLALSPDGRYVAVADKDIRIWALPNKDAEP